jgi:hypothetical protein
MTAIPHDKGERVMTEMLLNWVADTLARSDIIDLYFIVSDLIDIPISEAEACETAYFDAMATHTIESDQNIKSKRIPLGKLVL